jgi:hypothetical protein
MSSSTESNFRNAFKNFGARGGVAASDTAASSSGGGAFNRASDWLGGVRSQVSGYVPVSMGGAAQPQEEDWLGLSWFQVLFFFQFINLFLFIVPPPKIALVAYCSRDTSLCAFFFLAFYYSVIVMTNKIQPILY